MAKTVNGTVENVISSPPRTAEGKRVTVTLDSDLYLKAGDRVEIVKAPHTDEELGAMFRKALLGGGGTVTERRRILDSLAEDVENDVGWPVLAEVIRRVREDIR